MAFLKRGDLIELEITKGHFNHIRSLNMYERHRIANENNVSPCCHMNMYRDLNVIRCGFCKGEVIINLTMENEELNKIS